MSNELSGSELSRLCKAGRKCRLIGLDVDNMDRVELTAAIGYLSIKNSDLKRLVEAKNEKLRSVFAKLLTS